MCASRTTRRIRDGVIIAAAVNVVVVFACVYACVWLWMCLVVFDMFIFVARFCVSFLHELRRVYIDNTNTKTHTRTQQTPIQTHYYDFIMCLCILSVQMWVCVLYVVVCSCMSVLVCVISVFVSNDIWRKFYGVYPKIAETLEPQSLNPKAQPPPSPNLVIPFRFCVSSFYYAICSTSFYCKYTQRYENTHLPIQTH